MYFDTDVPVFAAHLLSSGRWEVIAPVAHELSGRHGIRRLARMSGGMHRRMKIASGPSHALKKG
jgi:hypothetical protein